MFPAPAERVSRLQVRRAIQLPLTCEGLTCMERTGFVQNQQHFRRLNKRSRNFVTVVMLPGRYLQSARHGLMIIPEDFIGC